MRPLLLCLATLAAAAAEAGAPEAPSQPGPPDVDDDGAMFPPWSCSAAPWVRTRGPVALGSFQADLGTGRRICPRTEVGLGGRFAAIIDTPNFYGHLAIDGVLFGSYALRHDVELFGTVEAVTYDYVQNASLKGSSLTLGNATVGATYQFEHHREAHLIHGVWGRILLPTASNIPGARLLGGELGHTTSWATPWDISWLEVHSSLAVNLTAAVGQGPALPFLTGTLVLGVQASWWHWLAVVLDLDGRLGPRSALAPAFALRAQIFNVHADLSATVPLAGSDRHDLVVGLRVSYSF